MEKSELRKFKYEKPVILDLEAKAKGAGILYCNSYGTGDNSCNNGASAYYCVTTGSNPTVADPYLCSHGSTTDGCGSGTDSSNDCVDGTTVSSWCATGTGGP